MKPYTKVNKAGNDEDLRRNWRGDKKYAGKKKDRPFKKKMRQWLKRNCAQIETLLLWVGGSYFY